MSAMAESVLFDAVITSTCSITVDITGTLVLDGVSGNFSTSLGGGVKPTLSSTTNAAAVYTLTASEPLGWATSPPNQPAAIFNLMKDNDGVGANPTAVWGSGGGVLLQNAGTDSWTFDLTVSQQPGTSFPPGTYQAISTVTCSP